MATATSGGSASVDPYSALLWRIDNVPSSVVSVQEREVLKDIVLYGNKAHTESLEVALELHESEGSAFHIRRLADAEHSEAAAEVKALRQQPVVALRLDVVHGNNPRLNPSFTPRTMFNQHEHREALAREVFAKYDKDKSGIIDRGELKSLLTDLGFPRAFTEAAFDVADTSGDGKVDYNEFVAFYNALLVRIRGAEPIEQSMVSTAYLQNADLFHESVDHIYFTEEYRKLQRSADLFYGGAEPQFGEELIAEALAYVDTLCDPPTNLSEELLTRALELVACKDKPVPLKDPVLVFHTVSVLTTRAHFYRYSLYALYKYHHEANGAESLQLYLKYKTRTKSRNERWMVKRKASCEEFDRERREIMESLRARPSYRDRSASAAARAVAEAKSSESAGTKKKKVKKKAKPRWLLLYESAHKGVSAFIGAGSGEVGPAASEKSKK